MMCKDECRQEKRKMQQTVKVTVHMFRDVPVQPILLDGKTTYTWPREEHLEAVVDVLDEEFDCCSLVVKYDLAPELFNASEFARSNAKALYDAVRLAADILGLKIDSPFNISRVVGIVAVIEDKIALDITGAHCLAPDKAVPLWGMLLGFGRSVCICTKRDDETYREYASRKLAECNQAMPAALQKLFSISLGCQ